jgi:hypothetical protein
VRLFAFATSAHEPKIFALLTALVVGELFWDTPIEQSSAARNVFHDLLISARGRVIVFEVDPEVLATSSYVTARHYGGIYARMEELIVGDQARTRDPRGHGALEGGDRGGGCNLLP